jgi:hypothetical protein
MTTFYLGTHMPHWLALVDLPLFVSHRRLVERRTLPRALGPWALDSGGFTEISMYGEWRTTPRAYIAATRRYQDEIGRLTWAAPQDWMCEPVMLAKTRLSVAEHQQRTTTSFLTLRHAAPDLPFIPVVQGWTLPDYLRHVDAYSRAGVDLTAEQTVGVGSVCRRQGTGQISTIVVALAARGIRVHGFGVKTKGLAAYWPYLASADSMAWSSRGRRVPGCTSGHKTEANCLAFAGSWRDRVLSAIARPVQLDLFGQVMS